MPKLMYRVEGEEGEFDTPEWVDRLEEAFGGSESLQRVVSELDEISTSVVRRTFLTRALKGLSTLARQLDDDRLGEATSSSSDVEVLLAALEEVPEIPVDEGESQWLKARLRGRRQKEELLNAEGGTASSSAMGELLSITRQAVDQRRKEGKLLALQPGGRAYRYPVWQVDDDGTLNGLKEVLDILEEQDPWMSMQFFLRENPRLQNRRPLDVLREGTEAGLQRVREAATSYGDQGAD